MTIAIEVNHRDIPFTLDWENRRWHASEKLMESDFPVIATVDGERYELYSDETFAEVETH